MALFKRKPKVLDLTEHYRRQEEEAVPETQQDNFLGSLASASTETQPEEYIDVSGGLEEKRRKLAKRLMEMTTKMEELSNQIYHLQQRIEVLEKKMDVNRF